MNLNGSLPTVVILTYIGSIFAVYKFAIIYMNGRMVAWDNRIKDKVDRHELESVERRMDDGFKGLGQRLDDTNRHLDLIVTFMKKNGYNLNR